jgi:hypothetical protein
MRRRQHGPKVIGTVGLLVCGLALAACVPPLPAGTSTPQSLSVIAAKVLPRSGIDRPDEVGGYQVHVVYAVPSDGTDRLRDQNGEIARSVASFETWLASQAGGERLLLDTAGGGGLDVTFVRLPQSDAEIAATGALVSDRLEQLLRDGGFNHGAKLYAVYYEGTSYTSCASGAWPSTGPRGHLGAVFLHGLPQGPVRCETKMVGASSTRPGYFDFSMLHEIFHALGAAPTCAPHQTLAGHVSDSPADLMYEGDLPWRPSVLDRGHDDYYGHPANGCLDIANSTFLNPQPAAQQLPPYW